jgi:hypothetical protein
MSAAEVLGFLEAGETIILRKFSNPDEFLRITKEKLTIEVKGKCHIEAWIFAHFKEGIKLGKVVTAPRNWPNTFKDLVPFVRQWNEVGDARNWDTYIPSLREVVEVVTSILEPEGFRVYFYVPGKLVEEATPLREREHMVSGEEDYES